MEMLISGSIVLYKNDRTVERTIKDFLNTSLNVKLFLIDNSPTEKLKFDLSGFLTDSRVHYIFNNTNVGFGAGHNIAIRKTFAVSKYHLVLNPDVSFEKDTLEKLLDYAEKQGNIGLLMPKVIYPNGKIQYLCKLLPTPMDLIFRFFLPPELTKKRMEIFELRDTGYNKEMEVPYLSGCFMFLRIEALKKVGLFDERFFMYPEDIDLTRRINKEYKTVYYPKVSISHSHEKGSYKNVTLLYIHITNMIKYFNKWGWFFDKDRRIVNKRTLSQFE